MQPAAPLDHSSLGCHQHLGELQLNEALQATAPAMLRLESQLMVTVGPGR
jgi:hypothetical protein